MNNLENMEKINFHCPYCKTAVESKYLSTINVTKDPKLKAKLFSGEVFIRECPACHKNIQIAYDFIYHDMDKKIMIGFGEDTESFAKVTAELINGPSTENFDFKTFYADYKIRAISDINVLFEKIYIFDDQLDDRVIEFCKYFVLQKLQEVAEDPQHNNTAENSNTNVNENVNKDTDNTNNNTDMIVDLKYLPAKIVKNHFSGSLDTSISLDKVIGFSGFTQDLKTIFVPIKKELYDAYEADIKSKISELNIVDTMVVDAMWVEQNFLK